jgi:hypothetical protein
MVKRRKITVPEILVDLFLKRYEEMWATRVIQKGFKVSLSFHSDFDKNQTEINLIQPENEDFRAFLTYFRKFIATESDFNLYRIYDVCQLHLTDSDFRKRLASSRKDFAQIRLQSGGVILEIGNKIRTSEEIADIWINGEIFHDDPDKTEFLESLDVYFYNECRFVFLCFVQETSKLIQYVANQVYEARKQNLFDFQQLNTN